MEEKNSELNAVIQAVVWMTIIIFSVMKWFLKIHVDFILSDFLGKAPRKSPPITKDMTQKDLLD